MNGLIFARCRNGDCANKSTASPSSDFPAAAFHDVESGASAQWHHPSFLTDDSLSALF
jgi:hypothetical protein